MRHSSLLLSIVLLSIALPSTAQKRQHPSQSQAEQQQQLEDDKAAIQKLHDKDIEASLALDAPKLEALWTDDVVIMPPNSPAVVGRDANTKRLEASIDKMKSFEILGFDEQWQEVRIEGDWAYEWGTMSGRMRPFSGGKEIDYTVNVMRILNRQADGSWKIARSIYNNAIPETAAKTPEPKKPEQDDKDRLKN